LSRWSWAGNRGNRIADQRFVAALELGIKGRNDKPFVWTKTAEVIPKLDRLPVSSLCFKH